MDGSSSVDEFLQHYGVKGMRWGVRKAIKTSKSEAKAEKKALKEDSKWARNSTTLRTQVKVYNEMAKMMNEEGLGKLNNDPKFKDKAPLLSNDIKFRQEYLTAHDTIANEYAQKANAKVNGDSPNGRIQVKYTFDSQSGVKAYVGMKPSDDEKLKQSDMTKDPTGLEVVVKDGLIVSLGDAILEHDGLHNGDILEHYGVKGMKWGVRRSAAALGKRKASGKKAISKLSDEELNSRLKRRESEKKLKTLETSDGEAIANDVLKSVGAKALKHVGAGIAVYGLKKLVGTYISPEAASAIPKLKK